MLHSLIAAGAIGAIAVWARREFRPLPGQGNQSCLPATIQLSPLRTSSALTAAKTGTLIVANQRGRVSLIDLATGTVTHLKTGEGPHDAAVSPDGRWGVAGEFGPMTADHVLRGNTLHVIDMATKQIVRTINTGEFRGLHDAAFRPGFPTRVLITAQTARKVLEVDVVTGAIIGAMDTRSERSHMLAITSDGNTVFTTNEVPGSISRLDVTKHAFVASFPASEQVEGIAVAKGGTEIWAGEPNARAVTVRDATTGAVRAKLDGFTQPVKLMATPEGKRVVITDHECRTLAIGDAETRRVVRVIQLPSLPTIGDFSPDGRVAFVALGSAGVVIAVDLETGDLVGRYEVGGWPDGIGWAPTVR